MFTRVLDRFWHVLKLGLQSFVDELAWAAAWLYRATNDSAYLEDAQVLKPEPTLVQVHLRS